MSQSARLVLEQNIEYTQNLLLDYLAESDISEDLSVAFGDTFSTDTGISLLRSLSEGNLDNLPQIEIRSATEINNARAAYSFTTDTIYVSADFLTTNADNPDRISRVLVEEFGHYLDFQANITDAPGDEGAIFSALVTGEDLSPEELATLKAEDDTDSIVLEGTEIAIERADEVIYVDLNATGENDGSTWTDAYTDLQDALAEAPAGCQIWVAAGTYTPTAEADRRDISFVIPDEVEVYGGFAGDETELGERSVADNPTILSGDIGVADDSSDNSVRVVNISETSRSSVLDGFTIRDGNADVDALGSDGSGIFGEQSRAILRNLIVTNNNASGFGGGMYSQGSRNQLVNVEFISNTASDGGGLYNNSSNSVLSNVSFEDNSSENSGGAILNDGSNVEIADATFAGNLAGASGGAIFNGESEPVINNTIFEDNSAGDSGGAIYNTESSPIITRVEFRSNNANALGGAIYNEGSDVQGRVANGIFEDNSAEFGGAVYNRLSSNQGVNLTFANNEASISGAAVYTEGDEDSDSNPPIYSNSIFWGNTGTSDFEPIFNDGIETTVTQSIVEGGYEGTGIINEDPLFVDEEGGDLRLLEESPGIDAGSLEAVVGQTDVAGFDRIFNEDVDLGAYEYFAPALDIDDVTVAADSETAEFTVSLVNSNGQPFTSEETVTVDYRTNAVSAEAGTDFEATRGTITFEPEETEQTISIPVAPSSDSLDQNVRFSVALGNPRNAEILDPFGFASFGETSEAPTVFRFFRPEVGVHFYTASEVERDSITENIPEFTSEGASFVAAPTPEEELDPLTGVEPVYRFLNNDTGVHVYTIDEIEREAILELPNFTDEGVAYYGYEAEQEGTIPLYRFYNPVIDAHFYTPSVAERDFVVENLANYQPEGENGIAYYVQPFDDTAEASADM